jgi:hypothetical protein
MVVVELIGVVSDAVQLEGRLRDIAFAENDALPP